MLSIGFLHILQKFDTIHVTEMDQPRQEYPEQVSNKLA